jgi:hypothetical protein
VQGVRRRATPALGGCPGSLETLLAPLCRILSPTTCLLGWASVMGRVNVIGTMSLVDLCKTRGIHVTNFATGTLPGSFWLNCRRRSAVHCDLEAPASPHLGHAPSHPHPHPHPPHCCSKPGCIYSYDAEHPIGGKRFTETDPPNFFGSFYSYTKGLVEKLLVTYDNLLILRLRMPISDDLSDRNFITKISRYAKVGVRVWREGEGARGVCVSSCTSRCSAASHCCASRWGACFPLLSV